MNVKLKVLSVGALFFLGGQAIIAQSSKLDTTKTKEIEEVVVVGFGQKKAVKELTGSVGRVGKGIADAASVSVDKALAGRVSGVQMGMATGQPGGAAAIRVRGIASVNGRNNPIIIIDGVRVAQGDLTQNTTTANILANLNEADIESITVLKDAVSTAVYGADAGTGVVVITTKAGRRGAARFNVSSETGVSYRAVTGHEGLTTSEWKDLLSAGLMNRYGYATKEAAAAAAASGARGASLKSIFSTNTSTDWRRETERVGGAFMQRANASLNGGDDKITYYSSIGYLDQDAVTRGSYFRRLTSANRVSYKATDRLTIGMDFQASYSKLSTLAQGGTFSNPILGQYFLRPTDAVRNTDGTYNFGSGGRLANNLFNVVALQNINSQTAATARVFANLQAEYKILKNLSYRFVFAPEYINIEEDQYYSPLHGDGYNLGGEGVGYSTRYFNFNVQNILSYNTRFGEKNNFNASLIQEAYKSDNRIVGGISDGVGSLNLHTLSNFIIPREVVGRNTINSRGGFAATAHYDYDRLLLVDLSGRQDRVSNFWTDKKTGYFWSAGIGVDLARLESLKNIDAISQLKFTASYGSVGNLPNADVSPFYTYTYIANYGDQAAAYPLGVDNKELKWETVKPLNVGFNLGLFKDRITLGAAYYNKKTEDMILDVPLSMAQGGYTLISSTAYPNRFVNIGSMRNSGLEFDLGVRIVKNDNFSWNLNGNFSTLDNKVLSLVGNSDIITGTSILRTGEVANAFYMKKWAGVDASNGKPLWYVNGKDGATTSNYNDAQRAIQGSRYAKYFGGLDTQLAYKGFALDAQLSYGFGNKIYDSWSNYLFSDGQYTATYPGYKDQLDYWTPTNTGALNPAPIYGLGNSSANQTSTRFLYKGDYMRLRTVKLSYTFNRDMLGNTGLSSLQIYVLGNNVWTHTFDHNLKFDPDLAVNGLSNLTLPPMKSYSLGVNLNF